MYQSCQRLGLGVSEVSATLKCNVGPSPAHDDVYSSDVNSMTALSREERMRRAYACEDRLRAPKGVSHSVNVVNGREGAK